MFLSHRPFLLICHLQRPNCALNHLPYVWDWYICRGIRVAGLCHTLIFVATEALAMVKLVALVVGASRGIGRQVAIDLAKNHYRGRSVAHYYVQGNTDG